MNTVTKNTSKPAARKTRARKPAAGLSGLTKGEQKAAIDKAVKSAKPASTITVYNNGAGYGAIPSGYKGAYIIAAFKVLGLIAVKGALITGTNKAVPRSHLSALLTTAAVGHWTSKEGYMKKNATGLYSIDVNGINNLSGRMNKLHEGRKLTSYGIDGIVDAKSALSQMLAFITKGTPVKEAPKMIACKVSIPK